MSETIKKRRKKHARGLRKGKGVQNNPDGTVSTHKMATYTGEGGKHYAAPLIAPNKEGKYEPQNFKEALAAGEVYEFKSKRRAERFAAGSWKKGKDKREAMKAYRKKKKRLKHK